MSSQPFWDEKIHRWRCLGSEGNELIYIDEEQTWKDYVR